MKSRCGKASENFLHKVGGNNNDDFKTFDVYTTI